MITSFRGYVACEPFASRKIETVEVGVGARKFTAMTSKNLLVPLKVVFGCEEEKIESGDTVYVMHEGFAAEWAKELEVDGFGQKIILVPVSAIKLVEK
jgi:hypothetical protein